MSVSSTGLGVRALFAQLGRHVSTSNHQVYLARQVPGFIRSDLFRKLLLATKTTYYRYISVTGAFRFLLMRPKIATPWLRAPFNPEQHSTGPSI